MSAGMPRLIPVMVGRACAGFLVSVGPRGVEAYDREERLLGVFPNAIEAAVAVEKSVVPACPGCGGE
jgi:hypothetical protein